MLYAFYYKKFHKSLSFCYNIIFTPENITTLFIYFTSGILIYNNYIKIKNYTLSKYSNLNFIFIYPDILYYFLHSIFLKNKIYIYNMMLNYIKKIINRNIKKDNIIPTKNFITTNDINEFLNNC